MGDTLELSSVTNCFTYENCSAIYSLREISNLPNIQYVFQVGGRAGALYLNQPEKQATGEAE